MVQLILTTALLKLPKRLTFRKIDIGMIMIIRVICTVQLKRYRCRSRRVS